ncbi:MAG: MFS transporter [Actinomycetes bacterium]
MARGLRAYGAILADPRARAFSAAGLVARMPLSMTGLGIVLLVSITTGSFARAGLITAVGTLVGAATAPWWGRLIDRWGQARVLVLAGVTNAVSLSVLTTSVLAGWPLGVTVAAAVGVGLGFSSAGSAVRARWAYRLGDSPLLNTAYALEAVLDEVVFIVGPVLVTLLATALHPAVGLGTCVVLGLVGAVTLASMRSTAPPVLVGRSRIGHLGRIPVRRLAPLVVASTALGAVFGSMEVVVVAFAQAAGVLSSAGFILMAWAFGSLLAGVVIGTISWRVSAARRFRVAAVLMAVSLLPLPFVHSPLLVALLLVLSGFAIAPTLIASVAVTQSVVPRGRLTEALGWNSTGLAAGLAGGAAGAGALIDASGPTAGFVGILGAGAALALTALFVRGPRTAPAPATAAPGALSPDAPGTPGAGRARPAVRSPPR